MNTNRWRRSCPGRGSGEGVHDTLMSNTLRYISLTDLVRDWGLFVMTNGPVYMCDHESKYDVGEICRLPG